MSERIAKSAVDKPTALVGRIGEWLVADEIEAREAIDQLSSMGEGMKAHLVRTALPLRRAEILDTVRFALERVVAEKTAQAEQEAAGFRALNARLHPGGQRRGTETPEAYSERVWQLAVENPKPIPPGPIPPLTLLMHETFDGTKQYPSNQERTAAYKSATRESSRFVEVAAQRRPDLFPKQGAKADATAALTALRVRDLDTNAIPIQERVVELPTNDIGQLQGVSFLDPSRFASHPPQLQAMEKIGERRLAALAIFAEAIATPDPNVAYLHTEVR